MVFSSFFRKPEPPRVARFAEGRVGYAVGDIHGRADLLGAMLDKLESRLTADTRDAGPPIVIFLGDYIDRGPQSAAVLDLLQTRPVGFERHHLMGNHEQSMRAFLEAPLSNRGWLAHGGAETLMAYGVQPPPSLGSEDGQWVAVAQQLKQKLPEAHTAFLEGLKRYVEFGDYLFVHAGIDPNMAVDAQADTALYWIRDRFLNDRRVLPQRIVHGHTVSDHPHADARRIGLDTGAYASGVLSAARFENDMVEFLSVLDRAAHLRTDAAARRKRPRGH